MDKYVEAFTNFSNAEHFRLVYDLVRVYELARQGDLIYGEIRQGFRKSNEWQ